MPRVLHQEQGTRRDAQGAEDWKLTVSAPIHFIGPLTCEGELGGGLMSFPLLVADSGVRSWSSAAVTPHASARSAAARILFLPNRAAWHGRGFWQFTSTAFGLGHALIAASNASASLASKAAHTALDIFCDCLNGT